MLKYKFDPEAFRRDAALVKKARDMNPGHDETLPPLIKCSNLEYVPPPKPRQSPPSKAK